MRTPCNMEWIGGALIEKVFYCVFLSIHVLFHSFSLPNSFVCFSVFLCFFCFLFFLALLLLLLVYKRVELKQVRQRSRVSVFGDERDRGHCRLVGIF